MSPNFRFFFVALFSAVLLSGCAKDEPEDEDVFELFAEGYTSDNSSKLAVKDANTYWVNGEKMWVNGGIYAVKITSPDGSGAKAVSEEFRVFRPDFVCAIYPNSAYAGPGVDKNTKDKIHTVCVPASYDYQESGSASGSKQILAGLPMVAYAATETVTARDTIFKYQVKGKALVFKHLTAAITVRVKNPYQGAGGSIIVDKIELSNNKYQLCGDVDVEFDKNPLVIKTKGGSNTIPYNQGSKSTVTLNFPTGCRIFGASKDFQIPILPVGNDPSTFTIKVYYKAALGDGKVYKCPAYERQTNGGENCNKGIGRACLGYAVTQIDGNAATENLFSYTTSSVTVDGKTVSGRFYEIATPEDLINLSKALDDTAAIWVGDDGKPFQQSNYIVTEDIDLGGQKMVPIHYYNLNGTERCCFNGNGHTIKNFTSNSVSQNEPNSCGLFGRSGGSHIIITNLNIENATYEFSHVGDDDQRLIEGDNNPCSAVGGIYAVIDDEDIIIDNCTVSDIKMGSVDNVSSSSQTDFYAAGIVGLVTRGVTIRNCKVGKATIDNTKDASSNKLVDQFGGAIGRIDIQNHPSDVITIENFTYDQSAMLVGSPAVFTSGQNTDPITFVNGLKNVRYGGVIANITRGCTLYMKNCKVTHKAVLNTLKSGVTIGGNTGKAANLYLAGLIGSMKSNEKKMYAYMDANCEIHGTIENNSLDSIQYVAGKYEINPYISGDQRSNFRQLSESGSVASLEASHMTLTVTTTADKFTKFTEPSQTLFSTGTKSDPPTPKQARRTITSKK